MIRGQRAGRAGRLLVSAVLADKGPEVIYRPSDVVGVYQAMGALADMSAWFTPAEEEAFDPRAVVRLPDRTDPAHARHEAAA